MKDFIVWLCGHSVTQDETVKCLCNLFKSEYRFDVRYTHADALIGRSRSIACTRFIQEAEAPFMIFVDTDISFTPENIETLYKAMQGGYDVIAGGYALGNASALAVKGLEASLNIDGQPHEMQYVSTGFMGISRKVLLDMIGKLNLPLLHKGIWCELWPFFESGRLTEEGIYISEDWDFCNKARRAGYKVYLHTGALVGHIKSRTILAEEAIRNAAPKTESGPLTVACLVQSLLPADLAEFTQKPLSEVVQLLKDEPEAKMAKAWKQWQGNAEDFYKNTPPDYLYELTGFNLGSGYWQDRIAPLGDLREETIVDIGCGIGTASLFLAQQRNDVVGFDISPALLDFANFRREKFGLSKVSFTPDLPEEAIKHAGYIIAVDVLEHIKDLRSFLIRLGDLMKPEARLYHADAFQDERGMHFDHSENISVWLREAGFIPLDQRWAIKK